MTAPGRARTGRALVLTDPTILVRRANERLIFQRDRTVVAAVPLREIAHVTVHGPVTLTGAALAGVLDAGIDVTLLSSAGYLRGTISSASSGDVFALLAQVAAWNDRDRRLAFARPTVRGKIEGQRVLLQRHALDRGCEACAEAEAKLRVLVRQAGDETDLDALRGIEGAAAAHYFGAFGRMLSAPWTFEKRVRRPARDPVNALLSFGYALAGGELLRMLVASGLDPRVGLLHGLRYGRESLTLDLVEEFRPAMVDRFTLRLLNRRQLDATDFETVDDGAVRLTIEGRKKYLERWEELMTERAPRLREPRPSSPHADESIDAEGTATAVRFERSSTPLRRPRGRGDRTEEGNDSETQHSGASSITWRYRMERQVFRLKRWLLGRADYRPLVRLR